MPPPAHLSAFPVERCFSLHIFSLSYSSPGIRGREGSVPPSFPVSSPSRTMSASHHVHVHVSSAHTWKGRVSCMAMVGEGWWRRKEMFGKAQALQGKGKKENS